MSGVLDKNTIRCINKEIAENLSLMKKAFIYSAVKTKEFNKKYKRIKCNCGHLMKDHYLKEGCCSLCGCTWYWPNDKYLKKQKLEIIQFA